MRFASESLGLGVLALCINLSLMLVKIGGGVIGNSYALIATNAFLIVKRSVYDATDGAASPQLRDSIGAAAANQPGVQRIEKCLVRKSGPRLIPP